jgi:enoyl-CoA hydratase
MKYKFLKVEKSGNLMTVTFNRPDVLNALNKGAMLEIKNLLSDLRADDKTRFVIFTGAGRAFTSGVEYSKKAWSERYTTPGLQDERHWQFFGHEFMHAMENLEQITIAAINGHAIGGGLCIAMDCDFRIASDRAILGVPELNLGVFYTWGATPRLTALIGPMKAKEIIMTCDLIDAKEAYRIGLVNKVVPHAKLMQSCTDLVKKLSEKGPLALRICKKQVNSASMAKMEDLFILEPELVERILLSSDAAEGTYAFFEKRKPKFKPEKIPTLK